MIRIEIRMTWCQSVSLIVSVQWLLASDMPVGDFSAPGTPCTSTYDSIFEPPTQDGLELPPLPDFNGFELGELDYGTLDTPALEEGNIELASHSPYLPATPYQDPTACISPVLLQVQQISSASERVDGGASARTAATKTSEAKSKKRKLSEGRAKGNRSYSPELSEYVERESTRCRALSMDFVRADFVLPSSLLSGADHAKTMETLYYGIGSPEMVATLQQLMRTRRERCKDQQPRETLNLSLADRVRAIQASDQKMAYTSFRRRCHIYQLFANCTTDSAKLCDAFVTSTPQSMAAERTPRLGNPQNLELARITSQILDQLYPNLPAGSVQYKQERKYVDGLRRLWQRLDLLVHIFGYGILGLVPLPHNSLTPSALNVTDEAFVPARLPTNAD